MSTEASLRYCDGETIVSRCVNLEWMPDGSIVIIDGEHSRSIPDGGYSLSDALGSIPRFLRINTGGVIELPPDGKLAAALERGKSPVIARTVHWLESKSAMATIATALVALIVSVGVWQGLPRLARRLANTVPASIEQQAGQTAYKVFSASFQRTALDRSAQARVQRQLDRLLAAQPSQVPVKLVFLQMGSPNAFALPGGLIVIADELMKLTSNEDEIAAVLAHELGHVERRHGLQSVLRNSAALIVVSTITGDLSTLSTFSATLPFLLLQYGYAREFEAEADRDAVELLQKAGIDSENLASILSKLEDARPKTGADFSYLSTHPSTKDRVQAMRSARSRLDERMKLESTHGGPEQ
ncbi:MAG TPA: M48 family metallopeptidase, partial [Opitutus sp.]|nr:M48 family metallopeptidase [Opitutus sp.]